MGAKHYFLIDHLADFLTHLEIYHYDNYSSHESDGEWVIYSKALSKALIKSYGVRRDAPPTGSLIRLEYTLMDEGKRLKKLADELQKLNTRYRNTVMDWKTKRRVAKSVRKRRMADIQRFLEKHRELISCYRYQGDRNTEGTPTFNLRIARTPQERAICLRFLHALLDAYDPQGIVRARRAADQPQRQRDGWIRRYARAHRERGWSPLEIAKEIQRELREGTWNDRSKLQYNLANSTICKIAGLKLTSAYAHQAKN